MAKCGNGVVLLTKNDYDFTARFPLAAAWGSKPFDKAPRLVRGDVSIPFGYIKAHARRAADIMTQNVFTATPETPLDEIAVLLERNSIKRVPIVRDGRLVGIVSRANLVQALATIPRGPEIAAP